MKRKASACGGSEKVLLASERVGVGTVGREERLWLPSRLRWPLYGVSMHVLMQGVIPYAYLRLLSASGPRFLFFAFMFNCELLSGPYENDRTGSIAGCM